MRPKVKDTFDVQWAIVDNWAIVDKWAIIYVWAFIDILAFENVVCLYSWSAILHNGTFGWACQQLGECHTGQLSLIGHLSISWDLSLSGHSTFTRHCRYKKRHIREIIYNDSGARPPPKVITVDYLRFMYIHFPHIPSLSVLHIKYST